MMLFHGSNIAIDTIDLEKCRPFKDFGKGFYVTTIEEQAIAMAKRVSRIYGGNAFVTSFEFNIDILYNEQLLVKFFEEPNEEWAIFVLNNRNKNFENLNDINCNHDNKYDIVYGPIANDDIALLFRTFSNGLIDVNTLVKEMKYRKLTNQFSFNTPKAIGYLTKVGSNFYE
jgi:hypothetical protein